MTQEETNQIDAGRYRLLRSCYIGINGAQSDNDLLTGEGLDRMVDAIIRDEESISQRQMRQ